MKFAIASLASILCYIIGITFNIQWMELFGFVVRSEEISKETNYVPNAFRMIGPYFGGNRNAPQDMSLYINMNKI